MNDNHCFYVNPDGINYFVPDHSRQKSDLYHFGDYADCWNVIGVRRLSGDDVGFESFAHDSLSLYHQIQSYYTKCYSESKFHQMNFHHLDHQDYPGGNYSLAMAVE